MISGNIIGGIVKTPTTLILRTEDGKEYSAVATGEEVNLTAGPNDIREGSVALTDEGVTTGEKYIPGYHTIEGYKVISNGKELIIPSKILEIDDYDYTKLLVIVCTFNTKMSDSVSAENVGISNVIYNVQSTTPISTITKDHENKEINLGIVNDTGSFLIVRYIMYKEIE